MKLSQIIWTVFLLGCLLLAFPVSADESGPVSENAIVLAGSADVSTDIPVGDPDTILPAADTLMASRSVSVFAGGDGTAAAPYQIATAEGLDAVRNDLSAYYQLISDIDLSSYENWEPIGRSNTPFTGSFNGSGHTISNLKIISDSDYVGLFGYVSNAGISQVGLLDASVSGFERVGPLVGCANAGVITRCFSVNGDIHGTWSVGGLIGYGSSQVTNSYVLGSSVSGNTYVGGLIGQIYGSQLNHCFTLGGTVSGTSNSVGGLAGNLHDGSITHSVSAPENVMGSSGTAPHRVVGTASSYYTLSGNYGWTGTYVNEGMVSPGPSTDHDSLNGADMINANIWGNKVWWENRGFDFETVWAMGEDDAYRLPYLQNSIKPEYDASLFTSGDLPESDSAFAGGDGTAASPYLIATAEGLDAVRNDLSAYYQLISDIDLSSYENWEPIGRSNTPFIGSFNGSGYTIRNLQINASLNYIGLFGFTDGAYLLQVGLLDPVISGSDSVGPLVGYAYSTRVDRCFSVNGTVHGTEHVGGLVGLVSGSGSSLSNSYVLGSSISGTDNVGGLCGILRDSSRMDSCFVIGGTISGSTDYVGGLVGEIYYSPTLIHSVSAPEYVLSSPGTSPHRIVGTKYGGTLSGNYGWTGTYVNEGMVSPGPSTDHDSLNGADMINANIWGNKVWWENRGFDFETVWTMGEDDACRLPYLQNSIEPEYDASLFDSGDIPASDSAFAGGDGTAAAPYLIATAEGLDAVRNDLSAYYQLVDDIDLSSYENWEPIGMNYNTPFTGSLNGSGHTISNLHITSNSDYVGLFGYVSNAGISQVGLLDSVISGSDSVGSLVGYADSTRVDRCFSVNGTVHGTEHVGGLVGFIYDSGSRMSNSYVLGSSISGTDNVGGLCGILRDSSRMDNCFVIGGTISGSTDYVGGLVGETYSSATLINSVSAPEYILSNSGTSPHRIVGVRQYGGTLSGNYGWSDTRVTDVPVSSTSSYHTSFDGADMINANIWGNKVWWENRGFDFETVWTMGEDDPYRLPYLQNSIEPEYDASLYSHVSYLPSDTPFAEGEGTVRAPYLITTPEGLDAVRTDLSAYYRLTDDLDLSAYPDWEPIGTSSAPFTGVFDGAGHTINNLQLTSSMSFAGLFGSVSGGSISKVGLNNAVIVGGDHTGGIAGYISNAWIKDCFSVNGTIVGSNYVGGILGRGATNSDIERCMVAAGTVSGDNHVGGILGYAYGDYSNKIWTASVVSLADSITSSGSDSGRIFGYAGYYSSDNNHGWDNMLINRGYIPEGTAGLDTSQGADVSSKKFWGNQTWWEAAGFDFDDTWTMGTQTNYELPYLRGTHTALSAGILSPAGQTLPAPASITIRGTPDTGISIAEGPVTGTLTAAVYDQKGKLMPDETVTWRSSNPSVLTINGNGTYTATAVGSTIITAAASSSSFITATAAITIMDTSAVPGLTDPVDITSLTLKAGWNFISIPKTLASGNNTAAALFAHLDTANHKPLAYDANVSRWTLLNGDDTLRPLIGYWIYANTTTQIPLTYQNTPAVPGSMHLYPGWNAIGLASDYAIPAGNYLATLSWTTLLPWNLSAGIWEPAVINGGIGANSPERILIPGNGYWLYVTEEGVLTGLTA